jgi:hypothetical protein
MLISHLRFCQCPTTASAGRNSSIRGLRLIAVTEDAIDFPFQVVNISRVQLPPKRAEQIFALSGQGFDQGLL